MQSLGKGCIFSSSTYLCPRKWKTTIEILNFWQLLIMWACCIISIIPLERKLYTPPPGGADDRDSAIHQNLIQTKTFLA